MWDTIKKKKSFLLDIKVVITGKHATVRYKVTILEQAFIDKSR